MERAPPDKFRESFLSSRQNTLSYARRKRPLCCVHRFRGAAPTGNIGPLLPKRNSMPRRFSPLILILLALCAFGGVATAAFAAEETHPAAEEHAIPLKPDVLFHVGKLAVTNSMVVTWIVAAGNSRLRAARDAKDQAGPDRSAEFLGVARGKSLQFSREHDRPRPGQEDLLVLRDDLHFHPLF